MKITVKNLVKVLGANQDFSTPQQVIDFLDEKYNTAENIDPNDFDVFIHCGEKAMYVFNHLFGRDLILTEEEINKFVLLKDNITIEYLFDGDIDCEWSEDIDFFKEENIPYIACVNKNYSDLKSFLNTLSIICKETNDTIKVECLSKYCMGEYEKRGFEIDTQGNVSFYGPELVIWADADEIINDLYLFFVTFNCKSFEDIDSLNIPFDVEIDLEDAFEEFFEAAGFNK